MSEREPTPVRIQLSAPIVFPDFRQEIRKVVEDEGWVVAGIEEPPEERGWQEPAAIFIITLNVIGHVDDVVELTGKAVSAVQHVAAAVRRRKQRRVDTVVKVIHGPKNEELARVDVPRPDELE